MRPQSSEGERSTTMTKGGRDDATTEQGTATAKSDAEEGEASDRSRLGGLGPWPRGMWRERSATGHNRCARTVASEGDGNRTNRYKVFGVVSGIVGNFFQLQE